MSGPCACGAVADADDLELLHEAFRDAGDHVGDQRALEAVQRTVAARVVDALDEQPVVVARHGDAADERVVELALRALHGDAAAVDRDVDAARDRDRLLSDARHGAPLPDLAEDFAADLALARLPVGEQAHVRGEDRDAHAAEHARHAVGLRVDAQARARHALQPEIVRRRSLEYFIRIVRRRPGRPGWSSTS